MTSRIFPTQKNDKMEHSQVLNTIDVNSLSKNMDKLSGIDVKMPKTASKDKKEVVRKKKVIMPGKDEKPEGKICEACGVEHPCSCDVSKAAKSGNKEKVAAMMEERSNRRIAKIQEIEMKEEQRAFQNRTAFRNNLLAELKNIEKDDECDECDDYDDDDDEGKVEKIKKNRCPGCGRRVNKCRCSSSNSKSLDKMSKSNKEYFARYAEAIGWPEEYVKAITASSIKEIKIPEATKLVLSNKKLKEDNKKQLIIAMHKESKLAPEQSNRIKAYWRDELGYQDVEWINDLVEEPTGK